MRPIGLMIAAVLIASGSAAAAWKEYPQPQLGFIVEFPADPKASTGNYRTVLVSSAPAHIYSLKEDHAVYIATVVDFPDRREEGASLLGEAGNFQVHKFSPLGGYCYTMSFRINITEGDDRCARLD